MILQQEIIPEHFGNNQIFLLGKRTDEANLLEPVSPNHSRTICRCFRGSHCTWEAILKSVRQHDILSAGGAEMLKFVGTALLILCVILSGRGAQSMRADCVPCTDECSAYAQAPKPGNTSSGYCFQKRTQDKYKNKYFYPKKGEVLPLGPGKTIETINKTQVTIKVTTVDETIWAAMTKQGLAKRSCPADCKITMVTGNVVK